LTSVPGSAILADTAVEAAAGNRHGRSELEIQSAPHDFPQKKTKIVKKS
jgi:hypothetical protein